MTRHVVLVVEDDSVMLGVLTLALRNQGYQVVPAGTGRAALHEISLRTPDAMILDLGLPDIDGFEVASTVRDRHELPIIVLSARDGEEEQIRALDCGANDYVTKPFREGELMARVRAALRRPVPLSERRELCVADLRIDCLLRTVWVRDKEVTLTPTEFELLYFLAKNADQVVTHRQLLRAVWGARRADDIHYLRVYMRSLRQKLEDDASLPRRIVTALGVGYRLAAFQDDEVG
ncbi:MAG TPA: response regulator transcription factor [Polyangiaceae bacterium]